MTPPTVARPAPRPVAAVRSARATLTASAAGRTVAAAASGAACYLAFPPVGAWLLAPVAVAGLVLAVRGSRPRAAFGLGVVFGLAFLVPLLTWIRTLGPDVWLLLAGASAVLIGLLGVALALVQRLPWWPLWAAASWVAVEALRARVPLGGFPWGRLAFAEAGSPLVRFAALGGAPLVSFAVALAGALLAAGLLALRGDTRRARPAVAVAVPLVAAAAIGAGGLAVPVPTGGQHAGGPAYATIAVVQGNVPRMGLDAFAQRDAVIANHVAATDALAAEVGAGRPRPDVVLWPENSTDVDPGVDPVVGGMIAQAVDAIGVPTLVGAVLDGPGPHQVRNAALVWLPGGQYRIGYVKRHLVPFGEYVPYRAELGSLIGRLRRVPFDFVPGHRSAPVTLGPVRLADVICYEVAYDRLVAGAVRAGGRLIVVQTNNATYGASETAQQLAMARLRAVEHGRAVAVAATSGISALVEPDGRVVARSRVFTQDVLEGRLPLRDATTVADRVTSWPEAVLTAVAVLALAVAVGAGTRRRGAAR